MKPISASTRLPTAFFARECLEVARDLLGCRIAKDDVVLRITEVEAYRWPDDTANHCRAGRTARNAAMWGPPGHAYVYLCYGIHHLLNLVTDGEGEGAAVLIRACEPLSGLDTVASRRAGRRGPSALDGPGKVGAALGLDTSWCHHPLCEPGGLTVHAGAPPQRIAVGPRIGVGYADPVHRDAPWRLANADSVWVGHRRLLKESVEAR